MKYTNIFYFKKISAIGGTEQFLYEIAKKYCKYDITIFYDFADYFQLSRLKKLVRCQKRIIGEKVKCEKAFFNFNVDMIDDVEAEEYYFISHANYEELGYKPPIEHPKLTHFIGVSEFATNNLNEYSKKLNINIKAEKCYNPLTLEDKEKVLILVSACRLNDKVKGGERTQKLIKVLDKYCEEHNRHYLWLIFTNHTNIDLNSKNVVYMKPRTDVRPYIAMADYVLQLSNDMETYCYTTNEASGYGVPIITTPLTVYNELPITDNERIVLDWDCSNIDKVAKQIFEKKVKPFKYEIPKDNWENLLIKKESTYMPEKLYKVEALDTYVNRRLQDCRLGRIPKQGEIFEVDEERLKVLLGDNSRGLVFVKLIEEPKIEQPILEETITEEPITEESNVEEDVVEELSAEETIIKEETVKINKKKKA